MLNNSQISNAVICRKCLKKYANLKAKPYQLDYKYNLYKYKCKKCGQLSHIVDSVRIPYMWKLFFAKSLKEKTKKEKAKKHK